ncbi:MAG: DUF4232 domain-containing protein [Proteobacteria bacterium]|nr:DUF4232 domain-containing protein [Pseudomonadota bacterium]
MQRAGLAFPTAVLVLTCLVVAACSEGVDVNEPGRGGRQYRPCRSADLALKRVANESRAETVTYRFENRGDFICMLAGHAGVALIGLDGRPLAVQVRTYGPSPEIARRGEPKVILRPGGAAKFRVIYPTPAPKAACRRFVKVTASAPGSDWGLDAADAADLCGDTIMVSTFWPDTGG